ncbi:hypothetical protein Ddc_14853 [Ditylenchus destructor]|nr:hypothetical protein Ddc_14853 [Ditylenchus destructor]
MAPNPRGKQQPNQESTAQSRSIIGAEVSAENATGNAQRIAAQNHEERTQQKDHQSEMCQDGYFPPTDDVDWASSAGAAMPSNVKESIAVNTEQQGQESDEPEVQIIEPSEQDCQSGRSFNAQGDLKGSALDNDLGRLQGAAAIAPQKVAREAHIIVRELGTAGEVPNIGQGGIETRGLHGAAAEAKKGHLMGAAAEAKKGHLMGAAAENVKGNLQGAAAIAHEQKLQREANGQSQWQLTFNTNDKKNGRGFDAQGGLIGAAAQSAPGILQGAAAIAHEQNSLVGAAAENANGNLQEAVATAHDQKVQKEDGQFMTLKDQALLPSENKRHQQNYSRGNLVGAAAPDAQRNLQGTPAMAHELKRMPEEDADEPIPRKQAKHGEFNSPSDVSAH